jgi:F-type H+-transporting ATPase subunit alpha
MTSSTQLDSKNLLQFINHHIDDFKFDSATTPDGEVLVVGDGIATVKGLPNVGLGEIVMFSGNIPGLALNLNKDKVGCIILDNVSAVKEGDSVRTTGKLLSVPVANELLGRVVNALGEPIDGKGDVKPADFYPLERIAPGVITREQVNQPLQTGIKAIDAMIPIGRGQRELIIGDRATGKSSIALSTIINQKHEGVICIYVAIGQKRAYISRTIAMLERYGVLSNSIVVSATASDPAAQQYIAPYTGSAIAEFFLDQGKDVLIVYDDLTKHAWAYREISLLLRRPSGREAYPGDVFYLHSRLLERACKLNAEHGGGSITALPIIETQANDVSAYIPTNVISITDGQIYLEADLFNAGQRPAINVGLSVSRVGSAAQIKAMKQVAGKMRLDLAQYRALAAFAQFSSDLDPKTRADIERGRRVTESLKQHWENPMPVVDQVISIWAVTNGFLDQVKVSEVTTWERTYLESIHNSHSEIVEQISRDKQISDDSNKKLKDLTAQFNQQHPDFLIEEEVEA